MRIPAEVKPAAWGAVGGAIAVAIVGFTWGGWVTAGTAEKVAAAQSEKAVVEALAPVCAASFEAQPDAAAKKAALIKTDKWSQGRQIPDAFVMLPNTTSRNSDLADACAALVLTPRTAEAK
jgi:hypothetical protein